MKLLYYLASVTNAVKLPVMSDVFPSVGRPKQMIVIVMVRGDNLSSLGNVDQGLTNIGEIRFGDDFNIWDTAVRH